MEKVNYIIHLNNLLERFHEDERIKQGHITLYLAFFHKWNRMFFKKYITVNRELIMERAKIKSKTTYHNYLRDLNNWEYLKYYPSYNPSRGSKIHMFTFGTSSGTGNTINGTSTVQNLDGNVPEPGQSLVPSYKHKTKENLNKQPNVIFNEFEVLKFFEKNNWPEIEGRKFYAYNRLKKFILKDGKTKINWQTAAVIFFKNGFKIKNPDQTSPISGYLENLKCKGNGRYD